MTKYLIFDFCSYEIKICKIIANWILKSWSRIFFEIDEPLDFNETLVNGSVFNVVSIINIRSFAEIII